MESTANAGVHKQYSSPSPSLHQHEPFCRNSAAAVPSASRPWNNVHGRLSLEGACGIVLSAVSTQDSGDGSSNRHAQTPASNSRTDGPPRDVAAFSAFIGIKLNH